MSRPIKIVIMAFRVICLGSGLNNQIDGTGSGTDILNMRASACEYVR